MFLIIMEDIEYFIFLRSGKCAAIYSDKNIGIFIDLFINKKAMWIDFLLYYVFIPHLIFFYNISYSNGLPQMALSMVL